MDNCCLLYRANSVEFHGFPNWMFSCAWLSGSLGGWRSGNWRASGDDFLGLAEDSPAVLGSRIVMTPKTSLKCTWEYVNGRGPIEPKGWCILWLELLDAPETTGMSTLNWIYCDHNQVFESLPGSLIITVLPLLTIYSYLSESSSHSMKHMGGIMARAHSNIIDDEIPHYTYSIQQGQKSQRQSFGVILLQSGWAEDSVSCESLYGAWSMIGYGWSAMEAKSMVIMRSWLECPAEFHRCQNLDNLPKRWSRS